MFYKQMAPLSLFLRHIGSHTWQRCKILCLDIQSLEHTPEACGEVSIEMALNTEAALQVQSQRLSA